MKSIGQLFTGLVTALGSTILVLGAVSLALLEGVNEPLLPAMLSPTAAASPITATLVENVAVSPTQTAPAMAVTATQALSCQDIPDGWVEYTIQPGDTLESVAALSGLSADEVYNTNCLASTVLMPGWILHLPYTAPTEEVITLLPTAEPCGPYPGWVKYVVQPGDTLYSLSRAFSTQVWMLQRANCMTGPSIWAGQSIYVPNVPTRVPTATQTKTATPAPTNTTIVIVPTEETPSATPEPSPTWTDTPIPTDTPVPSETNTAEPSGGQAGTATPTETP